MSTGARRSFRSSGRRQGTVDTYRSLARTHIVPGLGKRRLNQLRPSHVEGFLHDLGERRAASTVRQVYAVLRAALDDAVRDRIVAANPTERVKRPTVGHRDVSVLHPEEVRAVLVETSRHRLHALVVVAAMTGLRRGELLGLQWVDVDLGAGVLRVTGTLTRTTKGLRRGEPKTARGRRVVPLPKVAVAELRSWKAVQAAERLRAGSAWQSTEYVFTNEVGGPLDPSNVSAWYAGCAARAGVSDHGMHALRHSAATLMLSGGLPVRVVADALGHADVTVTLNTYAHSLDGQLQAAVDAVADALAAAGDG